MLFNVMKLYMSYSCAYDIFYCLKIIEVMCFKQVITTHIQACWIAVAKARQNQYQLWEVIDLVALSCSNQEEKETEVEQDERWFLIVSRTL